MTEQVVFSREVPWLVHPAALAASLARHEAWCWLDGSADPAAIQGATTDETQHSYFAVAASVLQSESGREHEFLATLETLLPTAAGPTLAPGFRGGWVTALSYEFGVALLGVDPHPDDAAPAFALRVTEVLELDHRTQRATLHGSSEAALDDWWAQHSHAWEVTATLNRAHTHSAPRSTDTTAEPTWGRNAHEYAQQVTACQAAIRDGDAYVLCLTDQANVHTTFDPLTLFQRLRDTQPSVRGAVIVAGQRALISASPERFLSLHHGQLHTHPIKGTRARGVTTDRDTALAAELLADPKERAENLMIVDLMRNDLSRVCHPGSVQTKGFLRVESHPHVHQLVSTVTGTIADHMGLADILTACFPGGSMTGAPKQRAVEILATLEQTPRGLYSGCFGWIGAGSNGAVAGELAMTIRSIEMRGNVARIGAGGGITADSVPEAEHEERLLKAQPILASIRQ